MENNDHPQLSVIVIAYSDSENFRIVLRHLRAQTVHEVIELIIVRPSSKPLVVDVGTVKGFFSFRVLEAETFESEGTAKASGVFSATAPLIAFIEDHSYPQPRWAESMIEAHRRGNFAAVGPVMLNANPRSSFSWASFLAYYGHWIAARPREEIRHLPANQSCYQRNRLLEYGSRLSEMLEAESVLHWDLLSRGHALVQEPAAKVYHLNYSRFPAMLSEYYLASRVFAAGRSRGWNLFQRMVYLFGGPLIPLVRLRRIIQDAARAGLERSRMMRASGALLLTLCAGAMGECAGYAFGMGQALQRLARFEATRHLCFTRNDLEAVARLLDP